MRDINLHDAIATIDDVAVDARRRHGRAGAMFAAAREWISIVIAVMAVKLGRSPKITAGTPGPRTPKGPLMFTSDLKHAWRRVIARPGTALLAAGMLGLGIGLTTAMFTIADALLLRPIPFKDPDRLALVSTRSERGGRLVAPPGLYRAYRDSGVFENVEGASFAGISGEVTIDTGGDWLLRNSAHVSAGLFDMLGVRPIRGRGFLPEEGRAGTDDRVILSETVWRGVYGGDAGIIGRKIQIDGVSHTVVGVMPADFRFPQWNTVVWRPLDYLAPPPQLADEGPRVFARWSADRPKDDVGKRASDVMHQFDPSTAKLWAALDPIVFSNRDEYYKRAVPMLTAGVGLVFLVLCANVSGLLLAQLTARRREYSVCSALGAPRSRLIREAAAESGFLGIAGVAAGVGLAWALISLARVYLPEALLLRSLNPLNLDERALVAAALLGLVSTVLSGVLPAWIGTAVSSAGALRAIERAGTETKPARFASRALLVGEIALACTLLSGSTLLVRSFVNLSSTERGLRTDGMTTAWLGLPPGDRASREVMATAIEDAVRAMPGVTGASLSFGLPPGGGGIHMGDGWRSDVPDAPGFTLFVSEYNVGADFFSLYGIPILRGRTFQPGDGEDDAVVGESLARTFWPGQDPVGRSFSFGKRTFHVIGLAREITLPTLEARDDRPEFYTPFTPGGGQTMLSIGCGASCPSIPQMRRRIASINAGIRIVSMDRLDDAYAEHLARPRAAAALGSVFAVIAVIAAAGGLLGVLTYAVNRRKREFGIRTAIGASAAQIRRLVVRDGAIVAGIGLAIGLAGGYALDRAMASMQYGVTPNDPITWAVVLVVIAGTTLAASWRPARHATRVDPVSLLREE